MGRTYEIVILWITRHPKDSCLAKGWLKSPEQKDTMWCTEDGQVKNVDEMLENSTANDNLAVFTCNAIQMYPQFVRNITIPGRGLLEEQYENEGPAFFKSIVPDLYAIMMTKIDVRPPAAYLLFEVNYEADEFWRNLQTHPKLIGELCIDQLPLAVCSTT